MSTTATKTADGWRLSGTKLRISHAQIADGVMVAARIVDGDRKDVGLFLLDLPNDDCHVKPIPTMGMDATEVCKARFDNCLLAPEAEATRHVEGGLRSALHLVEQARLRVVFMAIGIAQASLELAVSFAKERTQFGRPIASFQLIQGLLAQMATEMEAARLLGYQAASQMMAGQNARVAMSMAKFYATDMAERVTSMGIQVHGAMGLTKECKAERYFRDAKMLTIPDGTAQIHHLVIGRALTGISAFR